jgi:hypothetical protein
MATVRRICQVVRWCIFAACVFGLSSSSVGCYNPKIKSGGFACSTADPTPCPAGFYCVAGLCQDHPGSSGGGGGGVGGNGGDDMSTVAGDMSSNGTMEDMTSTGSMPDLSQSSVDDMSRPPDMAKPKCGKTGSFCLANSDCCSNSCGNTIPLFCD